MRWSCAGDPCPSADGHGTGQSWSFFSYLFINGRGDGGPGGPGACEDKVKKVRGEECIVPSQISHLFSDPRSLRTLKLWNKKICNTHTK